MSDENRELMEEMIGQTIVKVEHEKSLDDFLKFYKEDGTIYEFYYEHDCCATCNIEDIVGELEYLVGEPLLKAEEVSSHNDENNPPLDEFDDSYTWTFYKFATIKGYVDVRWYGTSNGYYSESVSLRKYKK